MKISPPTLRLGVYFFVNFSRHRVALRQSVDTLFVVVSESDYILQGSRQVSNHYKA